MLRALSARKWVQRSCHEKWMLAEAAWLDRILAGLLHSHSRLSRIIRATALIFVDCSSGSRNQGLFREIIRHLDHELVVRPTQAERGDDIRRAEAENTAFSAEKRSLVYDGVVGEIDIQHPIG
jgi:hypothetical protein